VWEYESVGVWESGRVGVRSMALHAVHHAI
jgi:hypothetical protein